MSLDKSIHYGKEKRQPYRGAKAIDATCRNHGSCPHCMKGRKSKVRKMHDHADDLCEDFNDEKYS